ncbi:MAG TPA: DUF2929 family protein [Virgibacillus sp.]|jgi:hypothetical protein|nr:DUF2929 family protein [Virgibacillus sp.]
MRYIMVLIWSVLIGSALSYVLTSMSGDPFEFSHALILAGIFFVAIFFLGNVVLQEDHEQ